MMCANMRQQMLAAEHVDRPSSACRRHLADCANCRDWQRHLLEIETQVPTLPVPESDGARAQLLRRLREPAPVVGSLRIRPPVLPFTPPKERGLRKTALAVALSAAVVVLAVGLSLWPRHAMDQPQTVAQFSRSKWIHDLREPRLAAARTPRQRIEVVAEFADNVLGDIRRHEVATNAFLIESAEIYCKMVSEDLPLFAQNLAEEDRKVVLPLLARELGRTESDFNHRAGEASQEDAVVLRQIADAAHQCDLRLRALADASSI